MRSPVLYGLIVSLLLIVFSQTHAQADALKDAKAFIAARQYDKAIEVLEGTITTGKATAETYNELGVAYNWKQDFDNALKNYRVAAKLDKKYSTSALQILNAFKLYDEIIQVGESAVAKGDRNPTVLTALLNAYFETKNTPQYQRILDIVKTERYTQSNDANYRLYILTKAEVLAGHNEGALAYMVQMNDKSLLQYMKTSGIFEPISTDPRFIKMTE